MNGVLYPLYVNSYISDANRSMVELMLPKQGIPFIGLAMFRFVFHFERCLRSTINNNHGLSTYPRLEMNYDVYKILKRTFKKLKTNRYRFTNK